MIVINTVSNERFSLNGIEYLKNFLSFVYGDKVGIYNAYDKTDQRVSLDIFSNFSVNGTVYASALLLQQALIGVIYTRDTLGAVNTVLQGSVTPASTPTGTGKAFWVATQSGTYTNFGGVVVSANSFAVISRDALGVFSISQTAMDLTPYAQKTYVDNLVVGLLDDRGSYNASVNTFPASGGSGVSGVIMKGDLWYISVAGTLGGKNVKTGASVRALVDSPAQTSANWAILDATLGFVPENTDNKTSSVSADLMSTVKFPNNQAVSTYVGSEVAVLENTIASVASGSPKGTYVNLAALQAAYPSGNTNIYVTSNDGHWYYYNADWQDGGLYQAPLTQTIKSNESLSLAQRKGDVLYGILDQYTGEQITLSKITTNPVVDGIIYFQLGSEYFKREFGSSVNALWWGVKGDGITDDIIPINAMLDTFGKIEQGFQTGENKVFEFPSGKTYLISGTIRFWGRQTLNFNFSKIQYTGSGTIIGKKLIEGTLFSAFHSKINQGLFETNTASIGLDFQGCNRSFSNENEFNFGTKSNDIIGVLLKHGAGADQCYANVIYKNQVHIYGGRANPETPTYGLMITGTIGISGANINNIIGGGYGGRSTYPIFISNINNNAGNVFDQVNVEGWDTMALNAAAVTCNGPSNVFKDMHIENYTNTFVFNSFGNVVNGLSSALTTGILDNVTGNSTIGDVSGSKFNINIGDAYSPSGTTGTKLRIGGDINVSMRFDTRASVAYPSSRNWALQAVGRGETFRIAKSALKDGDPSEGGSTTVAEFLNNGDVSFPFTIKPKLVTLNNAASSVEVTNDGTPFAFFGRSTGTNSISIGLQGGSGVGNGERFLIKQYNSKETRLEQGGDAPLSFWIQGTQAAKITATNRAFLINTNTDNGVDKLQVAGSILSTQFKLSALNTTPASATATGTLGEIRYDANHMYVCVATNTWKRSALTTW